MHPTCTCLTGNIIFLFQSVVTFRKSDGVDVDAAGDTSGPITSSPTSVWRSLDAINSMTTTSSVLEGNVGEHANLVGLSAVPLVALLDQVYLNLAFK